MSLFLGTSPIADGASTALLAGKADTDLKNATPTSNFATKLNSAGIRTVTQTYSNGTSWYRVYSDGWCEQGGTYSNSSSHAQDFVFLKPFKNTNYQVFTGSTYSSNGGTDHQESMSEFASRSTTGFRKYIWGTTKNLWWQACGYIN